MSRSRSNRRAALLVAALLAAHAVAAAPQEPSTEPASAAEPAELELAPVQPQAEIEESDLLEPELEPPPGELPAPSPVAEPAPLIRAIELRSDGSLEESEEVRSLLALTVGEPLTVAAVRRTLRNLRASGLAERAAVYRRPAADGDGVVAVVVLGAAVIVEAQRIEGDVGVLDRKELLDGLPQRPGEPLVASRVVRGVFRLQDRFADAGYLDRRVRVAPQIDDRRKRAVVLYRVEAGPRAEVEEVRFEGDLGPFTAQQLREPLRLAPGAAYRRRAAVEDGERLQRWLINERRHRAATVGEPRIERPADSERVTLIYPLEVGPRIALEVIGAEANKLRKRGLLPFLGEEGYDEALVLQAADRIRTYYQREGHYDVRVDSREERGDGTLTLILTIEPGPTLTLTEIRFDGNREVASERLRELMQTSARNLLELGSGRLVDATLAADLDNIRSFYALKGYRGTRVGPPEVQRGNGRLTLVVPIEEGRQQRVAGMRFEGFTAFEPAELAPPLPLAPGGPFHPLLLDRSLGRLRSAYERRGYAAAQVSAATEWDQDETLAEIVFRAYEGPQTVLDRIIVRGNGRTDESVVRRAIAVRQGEPVSGSALLEIERRLYRLGIFSRVRAQLTPAPLDANTRDLLVRVEEGRTRRVTYGFGYDSEYGFGGLLGFTESNVLGRGWRFTADAQVRQENQQFRVFLDQPYNPRIGIPVTYSVFRIDEQRESFELTKLGTRVEATKTLGRTRLALAYEYQNVDNRTTVSTAGRPDREDQALRVSSLVPSLLIDRRNDPLNPTHGWSLGAQLQYAFPFPFAAEADHLKLLVNPIYYLDLGGGWVIAGSLRLGAIEPLADLDLDDGLIPPELGLASSDVFIAERLFAGGRLSHRAFRRDRLGIPGETLFPDAGGKLVPAGGNGLAVLNLDLRFPLVEPLGGTVFFDTGNVWADWRDFDPADTRSGVGVGLRYLSPIGPLRFEVGWPLDRLPEDDPQVYFISLGYAF